MWRVLYFGFTEASLHSKALKDEICSEFKLGSRNSFLLNFIQQAMHKTTCRVQCFLLYLTKRFEISAALKGGSLAKLLRAYLFEFKHLPKPVPPVPSWMDMFVLYLKRNVDEEAEKEEEEEVKAEEEEEPKAKEEKEEETKEEEPKAEAEEIKAEEEEEAKAEEKREERKEEVKAEDEEEEKEEDIIAEEEEEAKAEEEKEEETKEEEEEEEEKEKEEERGSLRKKKSRTRLLTCCQTKRRKRWVWRGGDKRDERGETGGTNSWKLHDSILSVFGKFGFFVVGLSLSLSLSLCQKFICRKMFSLMSSPSTASLRLALGWGDNRVKRSLSHEILKPETPLKPQTRKQKKRFEHLQRQKQNQNTLSKIKTGLHEILLVKVWVW